METIESFINKLSNKYPNVLKTVTKEQMLDLYKEEHKTVQCCFIPSSGVNKGVRCSSDAKKDAEACSKHLRFVNKSPKGSLQITEVVSKGTVTASKEKESSITPVISKNVCKYIFKKGKTNKGKTCGVKCKDNVELFCTKHKAQEEKEKVEKVKKDPEPKPIKATSCKSKGPENKFCTNESLGEKVYNPLTKILFKSQNEMIAIGTYDIESGNILSLTEKDYETCDKYGYKYEEIKEEELSQVEKTSDPENQSDEEDTIEEEE